jgi:hypothetical protein
MNSWRETDAPGARSARRNLIQVGAWIAGERGIESDPVRADRAGAPHLNPIERLWGLNHRHTTKNTRCGSRNDFSGALLNFLRDELPRNWRIYRDQATDNFRIINPTAFRGGYRVSGGI